MKFNLGKLASALVASAPQIIAAVVAAKVAVASVKDAHAKG